MIVRAAPDPTRPLGLSRWRGTGGHLGMEAARESDHSRSNGVKVGECAPRDLNPEPAD